MLPVVFGANTAIFDVNLSANYIEAKLNGVCSVNFGLS